MKYLIYIICFLSLTLPLSGRDRGIRSSLKKDVKTISIYDYWEGQLDIDVKIPQKLKKHLLFAARGIDKYDYCYDSDNDTLLICCVDFYMNSYPFLVESTVMDSKIKFSTHRFYIPFKPYVFHIGGHFDYIDIPQEQRHKKTIDLASVDYTNLKELIESAPIMAEAAVGYIWKNDVDSFSFIYDRYGYTDDEWDWLDTDTEGFESACRLVIKNGRISEISYWRYCFHFLRKEIEMEIIEKYYTVVGG